MKVKSLVTFLLISIFFACGPKVGKDSNIVLKETKSYISKIDSNSTLKTEMTEGALTDTEGFKDIGTFKYTIYFDENTSELLKIKNVEKTTKTITETYYFQENELVFLQSVSGNDIKTIYLKKGRVISETNTTSEDQQLMIEKANRFYKAFLKSH